MTEQRAKYNAIITHVDGHTFASRAEARRYQELKLLERAGEIQNLTLQPRYKLVVNGVLICHYIADFLYLDVATNRMITEDVKGVRTAVYRIKRKLMRACYGIDVLETE